MLALKSNDNVMMVKSLMVQSAFLTQLTVYSFIGNYLKSQMEEIRFSIYQSAWYDFPAKLMKNLVFIFMQTESPVTLQAGNFITINLSTYMSILKTSFSYLSVLRIMLETWNITHANEGILQTVSTWCTLEKIHKMNNLLQKNC